MTPTPREGPSPFLPGTAITFAWDSTALGWLKRCPRLFQLSFIEGWQPKSQSVHLRFGILYTEALEHYYQVVQEGMNHDDAVMECVFEAMNKTWVEVKCETCKGTGSVGGGMSTEGCTDCLGTGYVEGGAQNHRWEHGPHDSKIGNKNFINLLRSIIWYLDEFRNDPAQTVIAEDGTPLVERSFRMELDWGPKDSIQIKRQTTEDYNFDEIQTQPYLLCGHLDRVVNFLDATYVMDHKTTKSTVSDYYFDQYEPNNQMTLYTIAARVIFSSPVRGVIIDAAQVAVGFTRFARGFTYRTPAQLDEWMKDLRYWLGQAEQYATDGYWPMNDSACFNCPFNQHDSKICAKDPSVRETFLKAKFTKENPWNPLKVRN